MTVFIVEDDSNVLDLLTQSIEKELNGVEIIAAADPIEALGVFERNKFKINYLICDYLLPIQNGKDFVEIVKEYAPGIKICVFTGDLAVNKKMIPDALEVFYKHDGVGQVINFLRS